MNYRYDPYGRNTPPQGGPGPGQGLQNQGQSQFPGISDPFIGKNINKSVGLTSPVPFSTTEMSNEFSNGVPTITIQPASNTQIIPLPESNTSVLPALATETKTEKSGFNLATSLNDLKSVVDRMGGLDGIVTTMGKVQKVVGSISQMAPLIKVLATSFTPGKKGAAKISDDDDDEAPVKRRRKKARKRTTGKGKGKGTSSVTPGSPRPRPKRRPPSV
ncbi:hypothetical protein A8990_106107 [Paenibacillus taihuensis]|uniref:YqfQ-like protein n=1 Tax=Paenibacillus taihuensis TaxID=1156355 RepID=A0A3D9SKT2_9BACL|nr:hypothetical protein [Paenibacillus taihuensis]REE90602.1 hypothetical protein A8990_106107 [Paenibacillus taihuensis]